MKIKIEKHKHNKIEAFYEMKNKFEYKKKCKIFKIRTQLKCLVLITLK
jgi:hypothetical protein